MMKRFYFLLCLLFLMCLGWVSAAQSNPGLSKEEVLSRIDQRGEDLVSMQAELHQKKWTDILEEYDAGERGAFYFLRDGGEVYLRKDIEEPARNNLVIAGGEVVFYQPSIKQAQKYRLGRNKDKAEFLLLGFGSDEEALQKTYDIKLLGEENLNARHTYKLELTPKSENVAAFFERIVLWIDDQLWVPIQQKLVEPSQDHLLIQFKDIQINPRLKRSQFEMKLPKDVSILGN